MKHKIIVTLIHGTFAKNAPWVSENSEFRNRLNRQLLDEVCFQTLNWSGKNSNEARLSAAKELIVLLQKQLSKYPKHKKFIISHSHGGNIALYALRDLGESANEFNLITMGTPFLNKSIRNYEKNFRILVNTYTGVFGVLGALVCLIPCGLAALILEKINPHYEIGWLFLGMFIYGIWLTPIFWDFFANNREKALTKIPLKIKSAYETFSLDSVKYRKKIYVTYDSKDEIKIYFSRLLSIWESIFFGIDKVLKLTSIAGWLLLGLLIFGIGAAVIITILIDKAASDRWIEGWSTVFAYSLPVFFFATVISLLVPIFLAFFKSNPFILGWENFSHMLFIKTYPDIRPPERFRCKMQEYKVKKENIFRLRHSIYNNQQVITDICHAINTGM